MSVVYLTGAPATGKSTLSRNLTRLVPNLEVFSYSERLRALVAGRAGVDAINEDEIRSKSSRIVTPGDIVALDAQLIELVSRERNSRSILIDSHPITREEYGFRITGFSYDQLRALAPDAIVCLFADAEVVVERIRANAMGRPLVSLAQAELHNVTQVGVASQYGILTGKPVYLVDSNIPEDKLTEIVARKVRLISGA